MTNTDKYEVIKLLTQGLSPLAIAEELNVSYPGVLKFKREFEQAKLENNLQKLLNVDEAVIDELANAVAIDPITQQVAELTDGVKGLAKLQTELQDTASTVVQRTKSLMLSAETLSDMYQAAEILCMVQNAFFNKNSTQVNIQNNMGGGDNAGQRYTQFLSDKPIN